MQRNPNAEPSEPETALGIQQCRDCGEPFPYDEDADVCPACVAWMHPDIATCEGADELEAAR
jgi:hypothetical protein